MKVVCIKNKYELLLTLGKVYDVIDERSVLGYLIVNDEGVTNFYAEKLNNLLE